MIKIGRMLGIFGVVLLLSLPLSFFLWDWQFHWFTGVKMILGAACLVVWLTTNNRRAQGHVWGRSVFYWSATILLSVVALAVAALINIYFYLYPCQLDLTKGQITSLSEQSQKVLAQLQDEAKIFAFYSNQDSEFGPIKQLLEQYQTASNRIHYQFFDPLVRQDLIEKYDLHSGGPRVVMEYQNRRERVGPMDRDAGAWEEILTSGLLRLTNQEAKPSICFSMGHGELLGSSADPRQSIRLFVEDLQTEGFAIRPISLLELADVPADCRVVVVLGSKNKWTEGEMPALLRYMETNGRLLALIGAQDSVSGNEWLRSFGIQVRNDTVLNPKSRSPFDVATDPFRYPSNHPIFSPFPSGNFRPSGLFQAVFPLARSIQVASSWPDDWKITDLAFSSDAVFGESEAILQLDSVTFHEGKDTPGPVLLGVAAQRRLERSEGEAVEKNNFKEARLAVLASSSMATDAAYGVFAFNRDLLMNTVAWLAQEESKITVRPRIRTAALLRLDEKELKLITYCCWELPLLFLAAGVVAWRRQKWSS